MLKYFPLPVFTIFLLCFVSLVLYCLSVYGRYAKTKAGFSVGLARRPLNVVFLITLLINIVIVYFVYRYFRTELHAAIPTAGQISADTLTGEQSMFASRSFFVDSMSAYAVSYVALIALVLGLHAMADKVNKLSPTKVACMLLVLASVEGIYYSNSLYSIFFFIIMSQVASYGLYRHAAVRGKRVMPVVLTQVSRIVAMLLLLTGIIMLSARYGPTITRLVSRDIEMGLYEKIAFSLLFGSLLAFFIRPVTHFSDTIYRGFFAMRSHALFFVLIRIVFAVFGAAKGLEKVPNLLIFSGCITILFAVLMSTSYRDPSRFTVFVDLFMKGFLITAMGVSYFGCFSAEGLAQYGAPAIESMIVLWLLYLPLSTALTMVTALADRKTEEGMPLYMKSGLLSITPVAIITLMFVLCCFTGMPPFATYPFMQLIYRAANFLWPFLAVYLVIAVVSMFFIALYMALNIALGKAWTTEDKENSPVRDSEISLPVGILLLWLTILSIFPGLLLQKVVAPSVESLMNMGHSVNVIEEVKK